MRTGSRIVFALAGLGAVLAATTAVAQVPEPPPGSRIVGERAAPTPAAPVPPVEEIGRYNVLYRFGNFFVGGQPSLEELRWLREQGVTAIVNLRTEREMAEYARHAYDERAAARRLGFTYTLLPVDGIEGFTPENLQAFIRLIDPETKTFIQCKTAVRATEFLVAYLIRTGRYPVEDALEIGQRMRLLVPLAWLLGRDFEISLKERERAE